MLALDPRSEIPEGFLHLFAHARRGVAVRSQVRIAPDAPF
jgi:hypothetical protein